MITLSHYLHVALSRGIDRMLVQFHFSAAFDMVSYRVLLYKQRPVGVGR